MFELSENIKLFAFDLDGTLYLGDNVIDGAVKLINMLREKYKVVFFTNNSTKSSEQICQKLNKLLIKCDLNEVYNSATATAEYLKESNIDNIYVIGSKEFSQELYKHGITVVDNSTAKNLVVGLDFDFNYNKIAVALSVLNKGGQFIVCNEDKSFPIENNKFLPGAGAMVGAISMAANRIPDFVVGKPNAYILNNIAKDFDVKYNQIIVVGDSYESDIQMALNNSSEAILINKNVSITTKNVLTAKNINELLSYIRREKWMF